MKSLLELLKGQLEATYDMDTGIKDISKYVISNKGFELFYKNKEIQYKADSYGEEGGVFFTEDRGYRATIYFSDRLIKNLEQNDPRKKLHSKNWMDFLTFVEELDHFLVMAEKVKKLQDFSLLELELHANVSKHQAAEHYLSKTAGITSVLENRPLIKEMVFHEGRPFEVVDEEVNRRYETAREFALKFVSFLNTIDYNKKIHQLRYFHKLSFQKKFNYIETRI